MPMDIWLSHVQIQPGAEKINMLGQNVVIVLATDGRPNDPNTFLRALQEFFATLILTLTLRLPLSPSAPPLCCALHPPPSTLALVITLPPSHHSPSTRQELQRLPVWVVVRLCTSEEDVVSYWSDLDAQVKLKGKVKWGEYEREVTRRVRVSASGCVKRVVWVSEWTSGGCACMPPDMLLGHARPWHGCAVRGAARDARRRGG